MPWSFWCVGFCWCRGTISLVRLLGSSPCLSPLPLLCDVALDASTIVPPPQRLAGALVVVATWTESTQDETTSVIHGRLAPVARPLRGCRVLHAARLSRLGLKG